MKSINIEQYVHSSPCLRWIWIDYTQRNKARDPERRAGLTWHGPRAAGLDRALVNARHKKCVLPSGMVSGLWCVKRDRKTFATLFVEQYCGEGVATMRFEDLIGERHGVGA